MTARQSVGVAMLVLLAVAGPRCAGPAAPDAAGCCVTAGGGPVELVLSLNVCRDAWIMTHWAEPPQLAVWLEDDAGSTVRTVFVTYRTAAGHWEGKAGCDVSLPYWVGRYNRETRTAGPPTFQRPAPDAVTGATPRGTLTVRALVPAGSAWRYFVEVNASGDFNEAFPACLDDGREDEAGNGQPSVVYAGRIAAMPGQRDSPRLVGRTDQFQPVDRLGANVAGITSAKELLADIVMACRPAPAASAPPRPGAGEPARRPDACTHADK